MSKLTRSNFKAWAESLDEKRKFYYTNPFECVIANFLREAGGYPNLYSVSSHCFRLNQAGQMNVFPLWLQKISDDLNENSIGGLTKKDILAILNK